jgi:hypothetical protein
VTDAQKWGDYEFRPDFGVFPTLEVDQGYRAIVKGFLDARPRSGFHAVNNGGTYYGYEYLRFADGGSFTDAGGVTQIDGASRIFPVDKLSGVPEYVSDVRFCDDTWMAAQLAWNPDMYGDSTDPAVRECVRKTTDLYHYITAQGVAGRWTRQYHPHASDGQDSNWFQRVSGDGQRSLLVYKGGMGCTNVCGDGLPLSAADVTVYPKGLNPGQVYDVRFEYQPWVAQRTGADLMASGVSFTGAVHAGELVWLNLPGHPGSGSGHTPPGPPSHVSATAATNMSFPGVDVTWQPAKDNNWVSSYQVLRGGQVIGTVAKGTYYFDHTPAATPTAAYAVRAVDGDGNIGRAAAASPAGGPASLTADDASAAVTYTGTWDHQAGVNGPFNGTQSQTKDLPCHTACLGFSGTQGQGGWGYQDGPPPACQQACQQFSGVQGASDWSYQEQSAPTPPPCHLACQQFSGVQGQDGWSYQSAADGVWADIVTYHEPFGLFSECCGWYDISNTTFSGLVSPRYILSGAGHDTARAWTAPKDGVLDISAQAIPFASGNQAVLTITQNGQPIWGPQTIDGTTTPQDTSVANVAVTAGDVIRFEVKGVTTLTFNNLLEWDPDIQYHGDPPPPLPPFADMATYHAGEDFALDGEFWYDGNGYLSARLEQSGSDRDVARVWTAPSDGVVDITGRAADDLLDASGSASTVSITKNDQVTWYAKLGPDKGIAQVLIDGTLDATIDLYAPDVNNYSIPIYTKTFPAAGTHTIAILPTGNLNPRSTAWTVDVDGFRAVTGAVAVTEDSAPGVSYSGSGWAAQAAAPASAGQAMVTSQAGDSVSFAFTGRSITWTGRICPSCGVADVYLDGRYVTRIDSYVYRGPDVWQAALFQYSWASLGSHVIKLVITDQPDWSSKGSQIYVDNFRVG